MDVAPGVGVNLEAIGVVRTMLPNLLLVCFGKSASSGAGDSFADNFSSFFSNLFFRKVLRKAGVRFTA